MMILFTVISSLLFCILGKYFHLIDSSKKFDKVSGIIFLLTYALYNVYYFQPEAFKWSNSLPLQLCDMIAALSIVVLIFPTRKVSIVIFFSAIPITTQAIITPTGIQDPSTFRFWLYWLLHSGIIAVSSYDFFIRKFKPQIKDFIYVIIFDLAYVALVLPINLIFDWNYGYIGDSKPNVKTMIDTLGPWPQRIVFMIGIALILQFCMYLLTIRIKIK